MNKRAILTIWPGTTTSNKEGKMGFEPTYEELKLYFSYRSPYRSWNTFWAYLWGIETMQKHKEVSFFQYEFWAYLWGIETIYVLLVLAWHLCFEPTYEELKLKKYFRSDRGNGRVLSLPMRNWNWQRGHISTGEAIGFEPTYEELKQIF